jgi:hypothetical protein
MGFESRRFHIRKRNTIAREQKGPDQLVRAFAWSHRSGLWAGLSIIRCTVAGSGGAGDYRGRGSRHAHRRIHGSKGLDGKFEFTVTKVERLGKSFTGQCDTKETAQGEFIIVRVNVKNVGNEAQMLEVTEPKSWAGLRDVPRGCPSGCGTPGGRRGPV